MKTKKLNTLTPETGIIYVIKNKKNDKKYVGQTIQDFDSRFAGHIKDARKPRRNKLSVFHKALNKYGVDNFEPETFEFLVEDLDRQETNFIKKLNTKIPFGYNMTDGGGGSRGFKHSEESKLKMATMKGKTFTEEHRRKIGLSHIGIFHSEETKEKISKNKLGKKLGPFTRAHKLAIANALKGKKFTEERKENIKKSLKGKFTGELNTMFGKHHSRKTRKIISEKLKLRYALKHGQNTTYP